MSRKTEIIKDTAFYALTTYGAQAFDLINGIFIRRFLGPTSMGVWTFLQVILNYSKHASLGTTTATARDVPYYMAKGEIEKAHRIKDLVFSFTMATAALAGLGVMGFAFLKQTHYAPEIVAGLFVIAILIVLQRQYNLYVVLLRAHKQFIITGLINIFSSILGLSLTLILVWQWRLYGLFTALILNYLFLLIFIHFKTPHRFHFAFSWREMKPICLFGGSMLISDILTTVLANVDRIMITKWLGFEALGIYSIAFMASNFLQSVPNMLAIVLFPHFQEEFSKKDDPNDLKKFVDHSSLILARFFPIVGGLVWIMGSFFIPILLPKFTNGIFAMKIICLATFFLGLRHSFTIFVITIKRHWLLVPINAFLVLFAFGITWLFLHWGWGIEGVAVASLIITFLNFLLLSFFVFLHIHIHMAMVKFYIKILTTFCYFGIILFTLDKFFLSFQPSWSIMLIQCLTYLACMTPLIIMTEKETGVLTLALGILLKKSRTNQKIA